VRFACFFAVLTPALAFPATIASAGAPLSRIDALPRAAEMLARPIWLSQCRMTIVEWRSTAELLDETTPSDAARALIDQTCKDAFGRYGDFLRTKKLGALRTRPESMPTISMLPGNSLLGGKDARALNDLPSRFGAVAPRCCYWGLYVDSLNHLFLRNDPLVRSAEGTLAPNPQFVRTLTHEISHILSSRLGVWDVVGYDVQRDEALAEEFVTFMGLTFPPQSSSEDLTFHKGRTVTATAPSGNPSNMPAAPTPTPFASMR
jgi:hypothetical protein